MKRGLISITYDDGITTDYTVAMQQFIEKGLAPKGTSYLITSYVGEDRLTVPQRLEMIKQGWDLQCHTHGHTNLTSLTQEQIMQEMNSSNDYFENTLGIPAPEHIAYPFGGNNDTVRNIIKRYRKTGRTTATGILGGTVDLHRIPGFGVDSYTSLITAKLAIDYCVRSGLFMTVICHALDTPEKIDVNSQLLDYCVESGIRIVTISELYVEILKNF